MGCDSAEKTGEARAQAEESCVTRRNCSLTEKGSRAGTGQSWETASPAPTLTLQSLDRKIFLHLH